MARQARLASGLLCRANAMKKWGVLMLVLVLAVVAGAAFLRPQSNESLPGKSGAAAKAARPTPTVAGVWNQVRSFAGRLFSLKKSGGISTASKLGLTVIHQPPVEAGTNAPTEAGVESAQGPAIVQAGLKAVNQLSIRGIVMSGSRSSAVINNGHQDASVFVGDEFNVKTPDGFVILRCEKIESRTVWLRIPQTAVLAELRLP